MFIRSGRFVASALSQSNSDPGPWSAGNKEEYSVDEDVAQNEEKANRDDSFWFQARSGVVSVYESSEMKGRQEKWS